jgi:hypothetical protein
MPGGITMVQRLVSGFLGEGATFKRATRAATETLNVIYKATTKQENFTPGANALQYKRITLQYNVLEDRCDTSIRLEDLAQTAAR